VDCGLGGGQEEAGAGELGGAGELLGQGQECGVTRVGDVDEVDREAGGDGGEDLPVRAEGHARQRTQAELGAGE
jgi:hypothetical protein